MTESALTELTEISSQVEAAVLFDSSGTVVASTLPEQPADRLAAHARAVFEEAGQATEGEVAQLEAVTGDGSLFVVRDGKLVIAATTSPDPTAGLVFYDLKSCLRRAAAEPKPRRKAKSGGAA